MDNLLDGINIVNIGYNLPAPLAASKLAQWGAAIIKVEPPGGDPFQALCQNWYEALIQGQQVLKLDLKSPPGRDKLHRLLQNCDLIITSSRLSSLAKLGISWEDLHSIYPQLSMLSILGFPAPNDELPGHDLTYQAEANLLNPPQLPRSLYADLFGAERAAQAALGLILSQIRTGKTNFEMLALSDAVEDLALPLNLGLTAAGAILGGGSPRYNVYPTKDGWIALATLEEKFWLKLVQELNLEDFEITYQTLEMIFAQKTTQNWKIWADEEDIPLTAC